MRALLFAVLLAASPALAQDAPIPQEQVAQHAIDGYIRPSFDAFVDVAGQLETGLGALCASPSESALTTTREMFAATVAAYSHIGFLRFGPLMSGNRLERLFLWPDPRGIALKQVQEVLATTPKDVLDPDALQNKSVALQGFNALEFVLFGTGADELATTGGGYRCGYGVSIATAIHRVANDLAAEWTDPAGIAARLTGPSASDPDYRSVREVLEEVVGALAHGSEGVRDTMLLPFLGRDGEPKPRSAPLWRSNSTLVLAAGSLIGIIDMVAASHVTDPADELGPSLAETIALEAKNVREAQAAVTGTIEEAVADRRQLQAIRYLVIYTQQLQSLIGEHLAQALDLSVGFSSLDGD